MQQFFITDLKNPQLSKEQLHQCKNVLRMRVGDQIRLVDSMGKGALMRIESPDFTSFAWLEDLNFPLKTSRLTLAVSLIRAEKLSWMIQKATETGVDEIVLFSSDHGVVKDFGGRDSRKLDRLRTIAKEAAEQSYRQSVPDIIGVYRSDEVDQYLEGKVLYADTIASHPLYMELQDEANISVLIGPEGGFSERERQLFLAKGFLPVSLGPNILRAETASLFVCCAVMLKETING